MALWVFPLFLLRLLHGPGVSARHGTALSQKQSDDTVEKASEIIAVSEKVNWKSLHQFTDLEDSKAWNQIADCGDDGWIQISAELLENRINQLHGLHKIPHKGRSEGNLFNLAELECLQLGKEGCKSCQPLPLIQIVLPSQGAGDETRAAARNCDNRSLCKTDSQSNFRVCRPAKCEIQSASLSSVSHPRVALCPDLQPRHKYLRFSKAQRASKWSEVIGLVVCFHSKKYGLRL